MMRRWEIEILEGSRWHMVRVDAGCLEDAIEQVRDQDRPFMVSVKDSLLTGSVMDLLKSEGNLELFLKEHVR